VAGDELLGVLRRINEEWGTAVVLAEHRLERCLPAADRVVVLDDGTIAFDASAEAFAAWAPPELQPPVTRLCALAGIPERPATVKAARTALAGRLDALGDAPPTAAGPDFRRRDRDAVVGLRRAWYEIPSGPAILRGVDLSLEPGEAVALMGRNGAGKSTLLRMLAGLVEPTRGKVMRAGRVALLLQNPGDYFLHDRIGDDVPGAGALADRHPRDVSGGERQRLALELVLSTGEPPVAVCPTSPPAGWTAATAPGWPHASGSWRRPEPRCWSRPMTRSSRRRGPNGWFCSATAARSPTRPRPRSSAAAGTSPRRPLG
jgi:energy-coupling factor transporter ATP-binding protein EcfA2